MTPEDKLAKLAELPPDRLDQLLRLASLPADQVRNLETLAKTIGQTEMEDLEQMIIAKRWVKTAIVIASAVGGLVAAGIEWLDHAAHTK